MRKDQLINAAQARATIFSYLRLAPNKTVVEIMDVLGTPLSEIEYDSAKVSALLDRALADGLVSAVKDGRLNRYSIASELKVANSQIIKLPKKKANVGSAELTVDVIKSTGRVRLSIRGLVIDIGVID